MHDSATNKNENDFLSGQPKKNVAVKAIIRSKSGKILVVKPNYKKGYQFPGGGVDAFEDPLDALTRELEEEINLKVSNSDLMLTYAVARKDVDSLILIYEYQGRLNENKQIQIQESELDGYKFVHPSELKTLLSPYYSEFLTRRFPS